MGAPLRRARTQAAVEVVALGENERKMCHHLRLYKILLSLSINSGDLLLWLLLILQKGTKVYIKRIRTIWGRIVRYMPWENI